MTANLPSLLASDLEGVLIPEIWVAVAEKTGIETLKLTTREISDYDELMTLRLQTMRNHGLTIHDVHKVIATLEPLPGAAEFVRWVRERTRFVIITDSFYEFLTPIMPKLGYPMVFAHALEVDDAGFISGYRLRMPNSKERAIEGLRHIGFRIMAFGDSYNDTNMLRAADLGVFFDPPANVVADFPAFAAAYDYAQLRRFAETFLAAPADPAAPPSATPSNAA
jgi:phosphoserine/homoserine phosphotransferase